METVAIILASVISAMGGIFAVFIKNKFDYKKKNSIELTAASGTNIYKALEYIQSQSGCARAYVFEFHNGEHFFSGRGQQKFSCTYEFVRPGVSAEAINSQGHRISNYNGYIGSMVSDGQFSYSDIDQIPDNAFKSMLNRRGVKAIYNVPIKTLNGKIIGILGIDFISKIDSFDFGEEHPDSQKFMRRQARVISGYLI
ncbi:MAG: hypothetical protein ACR2ON_00460 [Paracoccaceae bacterium]